MENMELYNRLRSVPQEAQKTIGAGRLKGFTDINPMWRIKALTEVFGPCGFGWWYEIREQRLEAGTDKETRAFVTIDLYYKMGDQVSKPIPGVGGASFVTVESKGVYVSDECFKMALTDAISTAAKAIGVAADIYYAKDRDKYTVAESTERPQNVPQLPPQVQPTGNQNAAQSATVCHCCGKAISDSNGRTAQKIIETSLQMYAKPMCFECLSKAYRADKEAGA